MGLGDDFDNFDILNKEENDILNKKQKTIKKNTTNDEKI